MSQSGPNSPEIVRAFNGQLVQAAYYNFHPLPYLGDQVNHAGKYSRPSTRLGGGVFVDPDMFGVGTILEDPIDAAEFRLQPLNRLTREDSHNEVFFGRFRLNAGIHYAERGVAVKPTKGLGELAMTQYMESVGVPTLHPVGYVKWMSSVAETGYLLTQFEGPVTTMDSIDWRRMEEEERWFHVGYAADTLALLHSRLLFHGDLEFKNVAIDDTGSIRVVDPELTVSALRLAENLLDPSIDNYPQDKAALFTSLVNKMSNDFRAVCKSIDEFIFRAMPKGERPRNDSARLRHYKRHLFDPYRESLGYQDSYFVPLLSAVYDQVLSKKKLQASQNILSNS